MKKRASKSAHTPPKAAPTTAARDIELLPGLAESDEVDVACDAPTDVGLCGDKFVWLDPPETKGTKEGSERTMDAEKLTVFDGTVDTVDVIPEPVIVGTMNPDEDTMMSMNVEVTPCTTVVTIWVEVTGGTLLAALSPGMVLESVVGARIVEVNVGADGGG
jgi:hypothetical protein